MRRRVVGVKLSEPETNQIRRAVRKRIMSCKWMLPIKLTTAIALAMAPPAFAQSPGYPATSPNRTPPTQRAELPQWHSVLPPTSQTSAYVSTSPSASPPWAHGPSENSSVNPFANIHVHQQQMPVSHGGTPSQPAATYRPLTPSYNTSLTSSGNPQPYAMGGGMPYSAPAYSAPVQQQRPTPQHDSFYDQPVQSYSPQPDIGFDPKGAACSTSIGPRGRSGWYGGAIGMIMSRDRTNNLWLSYDQIDIRERVLNSNDANFSSAGGAGADIGHYFNCGRNSLQFVYWGVYPGVSEANAYGANTVAGLNTILHFDGLQYDAGTGPQDLRGTFFFNADRHRVQRSYEAHNFELNLWGHNFTSGCGPLQLGWTAGVRYLRFDEDFLYSSDVNDVVFSGAPEELHYGIDVENNLIGFQLGGRADYCVGPRLNFFAATKVGIFGNHIRHRSRIFGATSQAFVGDPTIPFFGQDVDITSSKDDFAMIGDLSIGANWCINPCWAITAGYRAVGVSGVALSTNQVPVDFIAALDSVRAVDSNGSLILHGAFVGVNFCY